MKTNTKNKIIKNNLRQARLRAGLEQKQVAVLLAQKSTDEISRYERGVYSPALKIALKLEIIYQMPIRLLFQDLFEECRREISAIKAEHPQALPNNHWFPAHARQLEQEEFCFYAELLKKRVPSRLELEAIVKHVIALNNTASRFKQGVNPHPSNNPFKF